MSGEFDLIEHFFTWESKTASVVQGVGDDTAILDPPSGQELLVTTDTLVSAVHFPDNTDPYSLGVKSLAVNLSDLASMGGRPWCFTLALSLPDYDAAFLTGFANGLRETAEHYGITLVGGDTTRGPLTITIQAIGTVVRGMGVRRCGAQVGDLVFVTGDLGAAALGLERWQSQQNPSFDRDDYCYTSLHRPVPRVAFGRALCGHASAMIDCSDGLVADLGHVLDNSRVGAEIRCSRLPLCAALQEEVQQDPQQWRHALYGGDDYELIFTASAGEVEIIAAIADQLACPVSAVGHIRAEPGLSVLDAQERPMPLSGSGYSHF